VTVSFDTSVLLGWYQAKAGLASAAYASNGTATAATAAQVPTAPWSPGRAQPKDDVLVTQALGGKAFIDEKAAKVDVPNADADYKKLFAINQGLLTLQALANAANDPATSSFELTAIQSAFARGMGEIGKYVEGTKFDEFRLTQGIATSSVTSAAAVMTSSDSYVTAPLATGSSGAPVAAFQGQTQFDMTVTRPASGTTPAKTVTINFDLSEMGSTPRSMSSVADYMNTKLKAAGVGIRVSVDRQSVPAQTTTVNGRSVEITPATTQFAFEISGLSLEKATFSAPTTNPAVYVAQTAGDPDPDQNSKTDDSDQQQELLKLEAGSGVDGVRRPGDANYVTGRVFSEKLPDGVTTVHQMVTGADGSVYMVADGSGTVDGQPIKGAQDAVLLKYDAAGTLIYSRTLGAGVSASGASLAVSADGKVAIAGSVTGELDQGDAGADAKTPDSFVTVFDSHGQELWTDRQGALGEDQAQAVAFDAAGNVYVAGKTRGTIGGGTAVGGWDGYLRAYNASGKVQSTKQFGSVADDSVAGIVVNGSSVLVAGQDGTAAVVRSIDVTDPKQMSVAAVRNLGSLGGGAITGIGLDGSGNLLLGGSSGANLSVGNVTLAKNAGLDAFGARISTDLTSTSSDAVAYFGGSGSDRATAATIANGQVWLTGTSKTDLPGLTAVGKQDGFVAALDVGAGAVTYSQRFTAKDQMAAPEAIAVDTTGASALDRLGLPTGQLQYDDSTLITAVTSARAGDQFQIRMGNSSVPTTITIDATDTLSSLADKIRRAGLFNINVTTTFTGSETQLSIKPANDRQTFELLNGPPGRDALGALGLSQGLVRNTIADKTKGVIPADKGTQTYGLHLPATLDLASKADIKTALDSISNAITTVRAIYADLKQAATPKDPLAAAGGGQVPAYLQARIADYSSALARLTAGGSSDSSSGSSLVSLLG
jgi:hypothetical protein